MLGDFLASRRLSARDRLEADDVAPVAGALEQVHQLADCE